MIINGMRTENIDLIVDKAKQKKNGVYRFRGVSYRVFGGTVTHFAHGGFVFEKAYGFLVKVGSYDGYSDTSVKVLKSI